MALHEFGKGDHVRLISDGREMQVDAVIDNPDLSTKYVCSWFKNEEKHHASFAVDELKLVTRSRKMVP